MINENQHLFILCGEAFSGKSTLAKKISESYGAEIVGRDEIYFVLNSMLALEEMPEEDDDKLWESLWSIAAQGVKNQLLLGKSVVFDDNCLYFNQREELRSIAKDAGVKCTLVYLEVSAEILKKRKEQNKIDKSRHDVPSGWLKKDAQKFERPTEIENPVAYDGSYAFVEFKKSFSNKGINL